MTTTAQRPVDPSRYSKPRAAVLIGVHVLIGLHIAHWLVAKRTLAPLELNEVMYTLELGIVTAGFLLMAGAALSVALFGRFFCSWACHILALQDLAAWLFAKAGVAAKPVRSRLLRFLPFGAVLYMFVWPQVLRLANGEPFPTLHVASPEDPWASFATDNFWRNLPGPWITGLTFLICGFAVVYLLGSRSFCANACPYGAAFSLLDRIAPGRIALKGKCTDCARCTAVCQSGVWVHEEVQRFGKVVDPACLKDLDCVAVCPEQALGFGFRTPAGFRRRSTGTGKKRGFHLSVGEDVLAGATLIASLLVYRELYSTVPFLMSLGIGCALAWLAVMSLRLARNAHVVLRGLTLRKDRRLTQTGRWFAAGLLLVFAFTIHSGFVRYHEFAGNRAYAATTEAMARRDAVGVRHHLPIAVAHLETCAAFGLWNPVELDRRLADLHAQGPTPARADQYLDRVLAADPGAHGARVRRLMRRIRAGQHDAAESDLRLVDAALDSAEALPDREDLLAGAAAAHDQLAVVREQQGAADAGAAHRRRAESLQRERGSH
ncbi:MAG: 4Fe-4S binding protein [Planctomycetes bacterium]|nr:4Fe-4S binding protein [Planctomycetota bacterium]